MKYILFLMVVGFVCACSPSPKDKDAAPDNLLSPDSMVSILVDIHLVEAASNITRFNDVESFKAQELYPSIYKTHKTDSATFHSSFNYYLRHPDKLQAIYDKVLNELSKRESEAEKP